MKKSEMELIKRHGLDIPVDVSKIKDGYVGDCIKNIASFHNRHELIQIIAYIEGMQRLYAEAIEVMIQNSGNLKLIDGAGI